MLFKCGHRLLDLLMHHRLVGMLMRTATGSDRIGKLQRCTSKQRKHTIALELFVHRQAVDKMKLVRYISC